MNRFFAFAQPTYTRAMLESDLFFECFGLQIVDRAALSDTFDFLISTCQHTKNLKPRAKYDKEEIIWRVSVKLRRARNMKVGHTGYPSQAARQIGREARIAAVTKSLNV